MLRDSGATSRRGQENEAYANGHRTSRCLAAILAVDIVGYPRLMGDDKPGTGQAR
jgi:class 3 adenylate cyclase